MFLPKPPKTSLENIMAKTIPTIITCQPTVGGIMRAKSTAVTNTASVAGSFLLRQKSHSVIKPTRQAKIIIASERQPK